MNKIIILFLLCFFTMLQCLYAGQTGKIVGRVTDAESGDALPGVNILLENTEFGAATDMDGDFMVLNLPPGEYIVSANMLSYQVVRLTNIIVSADRTVRADFKLQPATLELGEVITVEAERPLVQMDLTATASSVSAADIAAMPVESLGDLLSLQAGVVVDNAGKFHMRGGRSNEVAFFIDGVSVTDPFSGQTAVSVEQNTIQELKVISGTFNAEYGKVMSGVVEVVTKDPSDKIEMNFSGYTGDYFSKDKELYPNIDDVTPVDLYNAQFMISGYLPKFKDKLGFYLSFRKFNNEGWMYGERRFNPGDVSSFDPKNVNIAASGDNAAVALNESNEIYGNAKLVYKLSPTVKVSYNLIANKFKRKFYNHLYKYNPDGEVHNRELGISHILDINHALSASTFYKFKLSHYMLDYESYLFEDPDDPGYVDPMILRNRADAYSFSTGGTNMNHYYRTTTVDLAKFDIVSQLTKIHQVKAGIEFKYNSIKLNSFQANYNGVPGGGIFDVTAFYNRGKYENHPLEGAVYFQDKIELNSMTLNVGLRYDYFDSQGKVPVDRRDPDSLFNDSKIQHQVSPRLGIAFPITASAVIHASYGHFFQIPSYEYLYFNPRFAVSGQTLSLMGNADLEPQSTTIYEIGVQQEFSGLFSIDLTGYYKDVRNLLGTEIVETYILGDRYAKYINRDYGNIRGITFAVNKNATSSDHLSASLDYTFQVAEGNASDPNHEFNNQQSDPPKKSNVQVVPLNWDQRHTINLSLSYSNPDFLTASIIGQFQSGFPYTPAIQSLEQTFENSGRKPLSYNVDLRVSKNFDFRTFDLNLFMKVYNLFDRRNETNVYTDTGRAGYSLVSHYIGERSDLVNTLDEWLNRPDYFSPPRMIVLGFGIHL